MRFTDQRSSSLPTSSAFTVRTILLAAILVALVTTVLYGMGYFTLTWLSSGAVPDYRLFRNYWDAKHGELTSFGVTPQYVVVGSTGSGVLALDRETRLWQEFTRQRTDSALPTDTVLQILLGPQGEHLYYHTSLGGLASSKTNLKDWRALYPVSGCPVSPDQLRVPSVLGEHWLVLGTASEGLVLYNTRTRTWSQKKKEEKTQGLSSNVINDLLYLEKSDGGVLLVATPEGMDVFRVDPSATDSPLHFQARELVGQSIESCDPTGKAPFGHLVVCRTSVGGVVLRQQDNHWLPIIGDRGFHSQQRPEVRIARLDREHNLLIVGTTAQGWDVYNTMSHDWMNPEGRRGQRVNDIIAFNGQWWVATDKGVQLYDPKTNKVSDPNGVPQDLVSSEVVRLAWNVSVRGIALFPEQTVFLLTADGGVTAFRPEKEWRTLIPRKGYEAVPQGSIVHAVVYKGELWLGFEDGQILTYNEMKHELRRADTGLEKDQKNPQFLTHLIASTEHLWCVISKGDKGPGQLFRYTPEGWRSIDTKGLLITKIDALGSGLLALTDVGTLLYFPDNLSGLRTFFDGSVPEQFAQRSMVASVSQDQSRIFLAPYGWSKLYIYSPHRHSWSLIDIPTRSSVKELHERSGKLYVVTDLGGLLRLDDPLKGKWTEMISESRLDPQDAADPRIISAAKDKDGVLHVVFSSGNVYYYNPENGAWQRLESRLTDVRQVVANQGLLWYLRRDGSIAVPNGDQPPSWMLTGGLGQRPAGILLAADDTKRRLWILTTNGQVGAYNLITHNWDLVHKLPGSGAGPLQLLRWGTMRYSENHDIVWLATNYGSGVFMSSKSDTALFAEFPQEELRDMIFEGDYLLGLMSPKPAVSSTQRVYRLEINGKQSALHWYFPPGGIGEAMKKVGHKVWVRTSDNHIVAYPEVTGSGSIVATPAMSVSRLLLPLRTNLWEIFRKILVIAWVFSIALMLFQRRVLLTGFRHPHLSRRRQAWRALRHALMWSVAVFAAVFVVVYVVCQVNIVSWPSSVRKAAHGQEQLLKWKTDKGAATLSIEGQGDGQPVFDQQGRFLFDSIQRLEIDGKAIRVHTLFGGWSFQVPTDNKLPRNFGELKPTFRKDLSRLATSSGSKRLLFDEGKWSWYEHPDNNVTVQANFEGKTVLREFHRGQWADMVVHRMHVPDDENQPILIETPAGFKDLTFLADIKQDYDLTRLPETRSFTLRQSTEQATRPGTISSGRHIYRELNGNLEWRFDRGNVIVSLNGKRVPIHGAQGRYRLASDIIKDFAIISDSSRPTFWVHSVFGAQKYTFDRTGQLVLLESRAEGDAPSLTRFRTLQDVTYAGTVWRRSRGGISGQYTGLITPDGVISKGRFLHDIVHDLTVKDGLLRLVTPIGFVDYKYDGSLHHVRTHLTSLVNLHSFTQPYHYVFNGRSWRELDEQELQKRAEAPRAVLYTADATNRITPAVFTQMTRGVYKLHFDAVSRLRLRSPQLLLQTAAGLLNCSLDRGQTTCAYSGGGNVQARTDKVVVFDRETSTWRLAERRQSAGASRGAIDVLLNWTAGSSDQWQAVEFVPESHKLPWDHVDYLSVNGNEVQIHTRAGTVVLRTNRPRQDTEDSVSPISKAQRWPGRTCPEPSWGEVVDVRMERDRTWLLCRKRLLEFRGFQHTPATERLSEKSKWKSGNSRE